MKTLILKLLTKYSFLLFMAFAITNISAGKEKPRKCILVFGAHADDVEVMAGGTFAKYIAQGYEGIYVCVINNTAGNAIESIGGGTTPDGVEGKIFTVSDSPLTYPVEALETMQIRSEEAIDAAKVFGAIPVFFDFREAFIWIGRKGYYIGSDEFHQYQPPGRQVIGIAADRGENISLVVDLLKKYQPEIVIIHTTGGEKHEHGNSGYLMYNAFKQAMQRGVPVGKLWMRSRGWLMDGQAPNIHRIKPDVRIDVKDYLDIKYKALNKHVSQNGGLKKQSRPEELTEEFITVLDNTK